MSKKVLHIIDHLGLGGAQTVVKGILEFENNSNYFLCSLRKTNITTNINHNNIFTNTSKNKFTFPIFKLRKFIIENDINVIHCHLEKSQIIGGLLKVLFFTNIKLVFHEHGKIFHSGKTYPFLINLFRNIVDKYVAVSNATKNIILQKTNFGENKLIVLYNFVDLNKFKKIENFNIETERKKYFLLKDDYVIGFASRLQEGKGWKDFLNSAKLLINNGYNFKFLIAGDGKDKNKIINFINTYKLQDNIKLIGYIENMVTFYNILDCFVFSSHREALSMTVLEVNASGIPIIASNISGVNEIMLDGKNSLLFESKNVIKLNQKIELVYSDSELKNKLINNGFEEVKKYSLDNYIFDLNKIYEGL